MYFSRSNSVWLEGEKADAGVKADADKEISSAVWRNVTYISITTALKGIPVLSEEEMASSWEAGEVFMEWIPRKSQDPGELHRLWIQIPMLPLSSFYVIQILF